LQNNNKIQVSEYETLKADGKYKCFKEHHVNLLAKYHSMNPGCPYFTPSFKSIIFKSYVGVIKVGDITIEVLPKTDKHDIEKKDWQSILLEMLKISLQVDAKTSTLADIHIRKHSVLETYIQIFLDEVRKLLHQGLTKKYRRNIGNQKVLKGKLLFHQHISKNLVHAERFYVANQVYDRNNIFNSLLAETLECIRSVSISDNLTQQSKALLLDFGEFDNININERIFQNLTYDRKTERYKPALEIARIILLNYHPDLKGGSNNILAIMFDMNLLWEKFIFYSLKRAVKLDTTQKVKIHPQSREKYWKDSNGRTLSLKPDLIVKYADKSVVIDTKWKYESKVSIQDIRQMYAYGDYFDAQQNYLLYPDKLDETDKVIVKSGKYFQPAISNNSAWSKLCGLLYVDLIKENKLNKDIGIEILEKILSYG